MAKSLLTASSMSTFLGCPRKYYFAYEVGLKKSRPSDALRFGSAFHALPEAIANGITDFNEAFGIMLDTASGDWDELMVATLRGLGRGYWERYLHDDTIAQMNAEVQFRLPIAGSRAFDSAGKIDGIAQLKDGRTALVEHKTCGESIDGESPYWNRLRNNRQLLTYVQACRDSGIHLDTIVYDVIRKPAIKPHGATAKKPAETMEEFSDRLYADTKMRPEFYFQRREVTITDRDLYRFQVDRRSVCKMILGCRSEARRLVHPEDGFPMTNTRTVCLGCPYEQMCISGEYFDLNAIPVGMEINQPHTELTV